MVTTINNLVGVNIGSPYLLAFMVDGSAYSFQVDTAALTQIAAVGTFGLVQDVTIWQGTTVLIVDTAKGYFQWQLPIGAPLTNLGAAGNVDVGLHSWVVTFVTGSGETNAGTNSIPLLVTPASQVSLTALPLGPTGTTARKIYRTKAGNIGNFFLVGTVADNTTTTFTDNIADSSLGAAAPSVGQIVLIDAARIGATIATYAGRVWISIRRVTSFTAPNSTTNFSVVDAGGSFVMTDSSFIGDIKKNWSSLDVLWVFGEASINQIGNVNVGTGNITTFNNTNISSSIGTIFPKSVLTYLRNQFFATSFGIYSNSGFTPNRLSSDIDGTIGRIDFNRPVVSCLGIHNEIIVFLVFCFYRDPRLCVTRPVFLTYFQSTSSNEQGGQKWYISSQGDDLTTVAYLESNGRYRVFGTDGNKIYELFTTPGIHHRLESPLAELDDIATTKEFNRLRATMAVGRMVLNVEVTPVTETGPHPLTEYPPIRSNEMRFISNEGKIFRFYADDESPPIDPCDVPAEDFIHFFPGTTCEIAETPGFLMASWQISNYGVMVGFDLDFDNDPFIVTAYCMEIVQRDQWGEAENG